VTRSAPVYRPAAPTAYYYAPPVFYPRAETRTTRPSVATSYAPFVGFFPTENSNSKAPRRKVAASQAAPRVSSLTLTLPSPRSSDISLGGRQTYCVRTCDGFYFPLSSSTGSDKSDELACNNLCPTAETKLYVGTRGADIDTARNRETGRVYASMGNAFEYRKSIDKSCSCSANGYGLASNYSVARDGTLRIGDIVMTKTGMKIFSGGTFPYRDGNFASIGNSGLIDNSTRENLRKVERASLPGKSGLVNAPLVSAKKNNETDELKAAIALSERVDRKDTSTAMRYIGPDRPILAR
jgi:Protein of unknown function (DUF2865)